MPNEANARVNVTLVDGADARQAAQRARDVGMNVEQTLEELGVLVGDIAVGALDRLRGLPDVAEVEPSVEVQIAPPDSPIQ